ncbi:MAG TPA: PilZ domain-containing protein [Synergistaceae bacterium]|nr:PilZ domain-containing protein [Synergistaceae bacterium]
MAEPKEGNAIHLLAEKIGVKADIHIEAGLYKGHYPSSLEDVQGDLLGVAHPLRRGGLLPIYREVEFGLFLQDEKAPLYIKVISHRCDLSGRVPVLWIRPISSVEKIQRRRFVRVPCFLSTEFWVFEEEASSLSGVWRKGNILDISLGGVRLQYKNGARLLEKNMHVFFFLELQETLFPCAGEVVWAPPRKEEHFFEVGVEFGGMTRSMEKALRVFIRQQEISSRE